MLTMKHISVTVDEEHLSHMSNVAEMLEQSGMQVEQVLSGVGIITGTAPEERKPALESVEGVASIDEELQVRIPSPDQDVQ